MTDDIGRMILAKLSELTAEVRSLRERLDAEPGSPPAADEYMTVEQAAAYFKISAGSLYRLKHLQCRRGRSVRFKRSALENHLRPRPYRRKSS